MERQIDFSEIHFDPSRIQVREIRQDENDLHSRVTQIQVLIDGNLTPVVPITSLVPLIEGQDFYISTLDTCQTRNILKSYLGYTGRQIGPKWRGNPPQQLRVRLADVHPFHLMKENNFADVISINFVGKGDYDVSGIDITVENNIIYQFAHDTVYSSLNAFPRNNNLPVLIANGSANHQRNGLVSEKYIIKNVVDLFNASQAQELTQLRNQIDNCAQILAQHLATYPNNSETILLYSPNPRPNVKGQITALGQYVMNLIRANFNYLDEHFDANAILIHFDDSYISLPEQFSEEGKTNFIDAFSAALNYDLLQYLNSPFNIASDYYNFDLENPNDQILNDQMSPLHYFQCILYAFMLQNLNKAATEREQILGNILNLITVFEQPNGDFDGIDCSPLQYILNFLSDNTISKNGIESISLMLKTLYPAMSHTEHVTQFNIAKLEPNRTLDKGFLLPGQNVFVVPEQTLLDIYNIQSISLQNLTPSIIPSLTFEQLNNRDIIDTLVQRNLIQYLNENQIHRLESETINTIIATHQLRNEQVQFFNAYNFNAETINLLDENNLIDQLSEEQIGHLRTDAINTIIATHHLRNDQVQLLNSYNVYTRDNFNAETINLLDENNLIDQLSEEQIRYLGTNAINAIIATQHLRNDRVQLLNTMRFDNRTINLLCQNNLIDQLTEEQIGHLRTDAINTIIAIHHLRNDQVQLLDARYFNVETINLLCQNNLSQYLNENQIHVIQNSYTIITLMPHLIPEQIPWLNVRNLHYNYELQEFIQSLAQNNLIQYLNENQIHEIQNRFSSITTIILHLIPEQIPWINMNYIHDTDLNALVQNNLIPYLTENQIHVIQNRFSSITNIIPRLIPEQIPWLNVEDLINNDLILLAQHNLIQHLTKQQIQNFQISHLDLTDLLLSHLTFEQIHFINIQQLRNTGINLLAQRLIYEFTVNKQIYYDHNILKATLSILPNGSNVKYFGNQTIEQLSQRLIQILVQDINSNIHLIQYLTREQIINIQQTYGLTILNQIRPGLTNEQINFVDASYNVSNNLTPELRNLLNRESLSISEIETLAQYKLIKYLSAQQLQYIQQHHECYIFNSIVHLLTPEQIPYINLNHHFDRTTITLLDQNNLIRHIPRDKINGCQNFYIKDTILSHLNSQPSLLRRIENAQNEHQSQPVVENQIRTNEPR